MCAHPTHHSDACYLSSNRVLYYPKNQSPKILAHTRWGMCRRTLVGMVCGRCPYSIFCSPSILVCVRINMDIDELCLFYRYSTHLSPKQKVISSRKNHRSFMR